MRGQSFLIALVALTSTTVALPLEKRAVEVGKEFAAPARRAPAASAATGKCHLPKDKELLYFIAH